MNIFPQRLKELRIERGYTLKTISAELSIPLTTYANYEQGTREPNIKMLVAFCDLFGVSADFLIGRTDY